MLLSLLLTTVFAVQIAYVIALALGVERAAAWRAVPHGRGENEPGAPVSVVVAARNEEDNLPALLAALAEQQHDNYEVVVVDDASTDRTADVVREWQKRLPHLRLITVEEPIHPRKKNALTIGIREARHPNLALTDAHCRPAPSWLRDGSPGDQNTLVIGYSPYAPEPSLLNLFARYETLVTGQQTAAAVGLGRPFMAVGRSLFYSKHVFDRTRSEEHTSELQSRGHLVCRLPRARTPCPYTTLFRSGSPGDQNTLVIGYSPYAPEPSLLNLFARYETLVTGQQTAAAVGLGRPFMAVGRSLFYSKHVFDRTDGFRGTLQSLSGDDDLFLQQVVKRRTARVLHLFGPDSLVWTDAPQTWRAWFRQKKRHASAGRFYPLDVKLHLGSYHLSSLLLWLAPFLWGWTGASLLAVRLACQTVAVHRAGRRLSDDTIPFYLIPPLELLYVLYNSVVAPLGLARIPREW